MSVDGVFCVLGLDGGVLCRVMSVVSPFSARPTCVFMVPRMGPVTIPGQPSILRAWCITDMGLMGVGVGLKKPPV